MQSRYPGYVPARPAGGGALALAAAAPFDGGAGGGAPAGGHYGPADYDYLVRGEESWYREPREEPERTPFSLRFFRKRMSIFEFWQLFVMWMAVTGLLVYIAGLIGFHHMLLPGGETTNLTATVSRATSSFEREGEKTEKLKNEKPEIGSIALQ